MTGNQSMLTFSGLFQDFISFSLSVSLVWIICLILIFPSFPWPQGSTHWNRFSKDTTAWFHHHTLQSLVSPYFMFQWSFLPLKLHKLVGTEMILLQRSTQHPPQQGPDHNYCNILNKKWQKYREKLWHTNKSFLLTFTWSRCWWYI